MEEKKFIDVREMDLEDWLELLFTDPEDSIFIRGCFPSNKHRDDYINTILTRSEESVKQLLRFFCVHTGANMLDDFKYESLLYDRENDRDMLKGK